MEKKTQKDIHKELPSVPTSYKVLIKGSSMESNTPPAKHSTNEGNHIWRLCSFRNPARSDGLLLRHWRHFERNTDLLMLKKKYTKVNRTQININMDNDTTCTLPRIDEEDAVLDTYPFARVNPSVKIYRYSDEFYRFHLADLDATWTKDETDLLFDLCEMFELRFIAIHDSFKWRKDIPLEKMKQRYYTVTKRIVEFLFEEKIKNEIMKHNNPNHPLVLTLKDELSRHPLMKYNYNPEYDRDRRQMLERSYRITQEQRELESQLLKDIKQSEASLKNEEKKRAEMRKLKRKFHISETDIIPTPKLDELHNKNVWLASNAISFYKSQLNAKHNDAVDEMLKELNIPPPTVFTREATELYCLVRGDAAIMINVVNKVESLKKELEHWQQLTSHLPDGGVQKPSVKLKEDGHVMDQSQSGAEHIPPIYQCPPHPLLAGKVFPKPKQSHMPQHIMQHSPQPSQLPDEVPAQVDASVKQFREIPQMETAPPPALPTQPIPAMFQAAQGFSPQLQHRQMMLMQNFNQSRQPGIKHMYAMKAANNGGASPQSFPQHMYAHLFQQQQRFLHQQMAQQIMFQQQQQQMAHLIPPIQLAPPPQHSAQQQFQQLPLHNPEVYSSPSQRFAKAVPAVRFGHKMQHTMANPQHDVVQNRQVQNGNSNTQ